MINSCYGKDMMNRMEIKKYMVNCCCSVKDAIEKMIQDSSHFLFVMDGEEFVGLFTDGDMRRYFLKDGKLTSKITEAMNRNPIVFKTRSAALTEMKKRFLVVYPIVEDDKLVDMVVHETTEKREVKKSNALADVQLVIMAGGKGTRLYPYTKVLPKALIPIGDETISELIINQFRQFGCKEVKFILNHKAGMIRSYFNDLEKDYKVEFYEEKEFLGTGGGLALLKGKVKDNFIVSNCDILVDADFECALKAHEESGNIITFICAMKDVEIQYGVVQTNEDGQVRDIIEKPEMSFLTNTGVYIINRRVIDELEDGKFIHLPDIAKRYIDKGYKVGVFPIPGNKWLDMGQINGMEEMAKKLEESK